ncbi:hypothetical protein C8Q73DRAFT_648737, partial [Cubamyces lactineus]
QFSTLSVDSPCTAGDNACVNGQFSQCVNGKFVLQPCAGGLICAALPLVNSPGTSITCTTAADRDARIAATGASGIQRRKHAQERGGRRPGRPAQGSFGIVGTAELTLSSTKTGETASSAISSGKPSATSSSPARSTGTSKAAKTSTSGKAVSSSAAAAKSVSVASSKTQATVR